MLKKLQVIVFLLLALVFCTRELVPVRSSNTYYVCDTGDTNEDGAEKSCENSNDGPGENDLLFQDIPNHIIISTLVHVSFRNTCSEKALSSPFSEIHLPPPELI